MFYLSPKGNIKNVWFLSCFMLIGLLLLLFDIKRLQSKCKLYTVHALLWLYCIKALRIKLEMRYKLMHWLAIWHYHCGLKLKSRDQKLVEVVVFWTGLRIKRKCSTISWKKFINLLAQFNLFTSISVFKTYLFVLVFVYLAVLEKYFL